MLEKLDSSFSRIMGESISRLDTQELSTLRDYSALLLKAAERQRDED